MLSGRSATRIIRSGPGPKVDEALFGDTQAERVRKSKIAAPVAPTLSGSPPAGGRPPPPGPTRRAAAEVIAPVIMAESDLRNMAAHTLPRGQQMQDSLQSSMSARGADDGERAAAAEARKAKIRALEAARRAHLPKTVLELEEEAERERLLRLAARARDEASDDVKLMNTMQDYAVTVTIRDRQLAEKRERDAAAKAAERLRDIESEVARLDQVARVHEKEAALRAEAERSAGDVRAQMEARLAAKQRALEDLRRQAAAAVEEMRAAAAADKARAEAERVRKAELLAGVVESNAAAIAAREAARAADEEEWRRALAAQAQIDARRAAHEDERERARKAREAQLAAVRGDVRKANDERAAQDELRAKRAFEAGQRAERERALERARKEAKALEELRAARLQQLEDQQRRLAEEIEVDKAEYARAMAVQEQWVASERAAADARWQANREHVSALLRQKDDAEAAKKAAFAALQEEGARERAAQAAQLERLRAIREQKVAELLALGVDAAYTVQLQKFDPMAAITRDYARGAAKGGKVGAGAGGAAAAGATGKK